MSRFPPKGVRPPQLEGKRVGRPKGSKNWSCAKRDILWGYYNSNAGYVRPPSPGAALWRLFASAYPDEVEAWLEDQGWI